MEFCCYRILQLFFSQVSSQNDLHLSVGQKHQLNIQGCVSLLALDVVLSAALTNTPSNPRVASTALSDQRSHWNRHSQWQLPKDVPPPAADEIGEKDEKDGVGEEDEKDGVSKCPTDEYKEVRRKFVKVLYLAICFPINYTWFWLRIYI